MIRGWLADDAAPAADVSPTSPPPAKKVRIVDDAVRQSPLNILDAILGAMAAPSRQMATSLLEEIDSYLQLDPMPQTESPTAWWSDNAARFPLLAVEARHYLSAPPSSIASKRLFSSAAQVYTDRCNCLLPKRADMLLFVKHNLPLVHFQY